MTALQRTLPYVVSQVLCQTSDIEDPGSKSFEVKVQNETRSVFVVHKDGQFYGYINECPHTGANLEWQEDQFLDMDNALIQCATHDALFTIDEGLCIAGPCNGDSLTPIEIAVIDDQVVLES
jgi:nitrite reductase/ring-hydroxylating ferredoxin subunit